MDNEIEYLAAIRYLQYKLEEKKPDVHLTVPYLMMGLAGEVGEVSNILKRSLNNAWYKESKDNLEDELGDVFWYLYMLVDELELNIVSILNKNITKINNRVNNT